MLPIDNMPENVCGPAAENVVGIEVVQVADGPAAERETVDGGGRRTDVSAGHIERSAGQIDIGLADAGSSKAPLVMLPPIVTAPPLMLMVLTRELSAVGCRWFRLDCVTDGIHD